MRKVMVRDVDDYHEIGYIVNVLNWTVENGEKKWEGEEIGFDYCAGSFRAIFYRGPYPKSLIREEKKRLKESEAEYNKKYEEEYGKDYE